MSKLQKIFSLLLPQSWFSFLKKSSLSWKIQCKQCGYQTNFWEQGGLRIGKSFKKAVPGKCPTCKKWGMFSVVQEK